MFLLTKSEISKHKKNAFAKINEKNDFVDLCLKESPKAVFVEGNYYTFIPSGIGKYLVKHFDKLYEFDVTINTGYLWNSFEKTLVFVYEIVEITDSLLFELNIEFENKFVDQFLKECQ